MDRFNFIHHQGKEILVLDYSQIHSMDELTTLVNKGLDFTHLLQKKKLLIMVDITNTKARGNGYEALKNAATKTKPLTKKDAIVGVNGLAQIILLNAINKFRGMNTRAFATREDALNFLLAG